MSSPELETFLARLYTDASLRERFLQAPEQESLRAGLSPEEARALTQIDTLGLQMAARSYAWKRAQRQPKTPPAKGWRRLWLALRRRLGMR